MLFLIYKFPNINRLNSCRMTSGKDHFYNTIYMIFVYDFSQKFNSMIVGSHDGATGGKIFSGNCLINIFLRFIYHLCKSPDTTTILYGDYNTTITFNCPDYFQTIPADWTPGYQNPGLSLQFLSFLIFNKNSFPYFIYNLRSR